MRSAILLYVILSETLTNGIIMTVLFRFFKHLVSHVLQGIYLAQKLMVFLLHCSLFGAGLILVSYVAARSFVSHILSLTIEYFWISITCQDLVT